MHSSHNVSDISKKILLTIYAGKKFKIFEKNDERQFEFENNCLPASTQKGNIKRSIK